MQIRVLHVVVFVLSVCSGLGAELVAVDGTLLSGDVKASKDDLTLTTAQGESHKIKLSEIIELRFATSPNTPAATSDVAQIKLLDGTVFAGTIPFSSPDGTIKLQLKTGMELKMPLSEMRSIFLQQPRSSEPPKLKPLQQGQSHIVLINGRIETGQVEYFTPQIVGLRVGEDKRDRFRKSIISAIVFSDKKLARPKGSVLVRSLFGDEIPGDVVSLDRKTLVLKSSMGKISMPVRYLYSIERADDKVSYLTELKPTAKESIAFLDTVHPPAFDTDLFGFPLRFANLTFDHGIAMHSRTLLNYRLNGKFDALVMSVCIDPRYSKRGEAELTILVNDKETQTITLRHGAPPEDLVIPLNSARTVGFVFDYGRFGSSGDHGLCLNPRLVRK